MRVLVTGGAGFLGYHVVRALADAGHGALVVDRLDHGRPADWPDAVPLYAEDIRTWQPSPRETADAVLHLAAQADVPSGERNPAAHLNDNVSGTAAALKLAQDLGARTFCLASSAAVYGNPEDDGPRAESDQPAPASIYGFSKWAAEELVALWHRTRGLDVTVLRPANIYGPGQGEDGEGGVVTQFARSLTEGRPLTRFGDGQQTRDFIYVEDAALAFCHAAESGSANEAEARLRVFNVGTGHSTSINHVGKTLASVAGVPLRWHTLPPRPGDIRHSRFQVDRAAAWGFQARTGLLDGLRRTWDSLGS